MIRRHRNAIPRPHARSGHRPMRPLTLPGALPAAEQPQPPEPEPSELAPLERLSTVRDAAAQSHARATRMVRFERIHVKPPLRPMRHRYRPHRRRAAG